MKKALVLLAGFPGTGKSYIANLLQKEVRAFNIVSQDDIKENIWDQYGFDNLEEKEALVGKSWQQYYKVIEQDMMEGRLIISDYPFSEKQRPILQQLSEQYAYCVITVRLIGDLDVLYKRQHQRDIDPSRPLSHLVTHYHKGDVLENRILADALLSYDEFVKRCTTRGYDTFELGELMEVDVTDFHKVDYPQLIRNIIALI